MGYIDLTYIQTRVKESDLIDMSRVRGSEDAIDEEVIAALAADASAVFDNYAAKAGCTVPVDQPTPYMQRLVFDLFLYMLYARKYDDEEMKDVYVRYNKAMQDMKLIGDGHLCLSGVPRSVTVLQAINTNKLITDRRFNAENLEAARANY